MWLTTSLGAGLLACVPGVQDLSLPSVLSDHMVLQRELPVSIWGRGAPGATVEVEFGGKSVQTEVGGDGSWELELPPLEASAEGRPLSVSSGTEALVLEDVVVGEVWICSGQSNMEWSVDSVDEADAARELADPRLRMFTGERISTAQRQFDVPGSWSPATADSVGAFSAVGHWFGRELLEAFDVPIGLVHVSWGGSSVQAWTSMETLAAMAPGRALIDVWEGADARVEAEIASLSAGSFDDSAWEVGTLPASFAALGHDIDGVIWFRRTVELPDDWRGQALELQLGQIDDLDRTFVNGVQVGASSNWQAQRNYSIPAELTTDGRLALAVRVDDTGGGGGFHGGTSLELTSPGGEVLSIEGEWRLREVDAPRLLTANVKPAHLYEGMLRPVSKTTTRGAIWYQGEANATVDNHHEYAELFPAFVSDFRATFGRPELPFGVVQLPLFSRNDDGYWRYPSARQAQLETYWALPDIGLAVTLELGDPSDIHPRRKREVGERLARWALVDVYGAHEGPAMAPIPLGAAIEGDAVRVRFDTFGDALRVADGGSRVRGFEVESAKGEWRTVEAALDGGADVLLDCSAVEGPVRVRYAWQNTPEHMDLVNGDGWPASPGLLTIETQR